MGRSFLSGRIAASVLAATLLLPCAVFAVPPLPPAEGTLDPRLFGGGVHPYAEAVASGGNDLFVAGRWTNWLPPPVAGQQGEFQGVAVWNSPSGLWGQIPGDFDGQIQQLAYVDGQLYAAGAFTAIDDVPFPGLARWDGGQWLPLGGSVTVVNPRLQVEQGTLYVWGISGTAGILKVGMWNGSAWSRPSFDRADLVSFALGAGGEIVMVRPAIWHYELPVDFFDGSKWSVLPFPSPYGNGLLPSSLAVFHGEIIAAGDIRQLDDDKVTGIARWDGSHWRALGEGLSSKVLAFAATDDAIYVHVQEPEPSIRRWDGSAWTTVDVVEGAQWTYVAAMTTGDAGLCVAGGIRRVRETTAANVACVSLDDLQWTAPREVAAQGLDGWASTLVASPYGVYAGGAFRLEDGSSLGQWQDGSWKPVGNSGAVGTWLMATTGRKLFAYGNWERDGRSQTGISIWNGSSWSPVRKPEGSVITSIAAWDGSVYAAGSFYEDDPWWYGPSGSVASWNGSRWTFLPSKLEGEEIKSIAVTADGQLYVGGWIRKIGSVPVSKLARWDGAKWHAAGVFDSGVSLLLAVGSTLYAGGDFTSVDGKPIAGLARLENGEWDAVGGMEGRARQLASDGKYLYAQMERADLSSSDSALLRWDGTTWERALTTPNQGWIPSMAARGGQLFFSGDFWSVEGTPSLYVAHWSPCAPDADACFDVTTTTSTTLDTTTSTSTTTTTTLAPPTTTTTLPATTTTTTTSTSSTSSTVPEQQCGDANGNGSLDASDALLALRTAVGTAACPPGTCDVDGSGTVTPSDALAILRAAVGLSGGLPCA